MLHVPETRVARPRFPVIDVHTHLARDGGARTACLRRGRHLLDDRRAMRSRSWTARTCATMVNLTGGHGAGLDRGASPRFDRAHPGRFFTFTEPDVRRVRRTRATRSSRPTRSRAAAAGRRAGAQGPEDARPLSARAGQRRAAGQGRRPRASTRCGRPARAHGMPVFIHVADPEAFFLPIDRFNERYEELGQPPRLVLPRPRLPELPRAPGGARPRLRAASADAVPLAARRPRRREPGRRRRRRSTASRTCTVELGARIGELGRQPRAARKFFDRYQDRILFGTDAVPPPAGEVRRSRSSATSSTRSTTASSRPRTSTSTTRPRRCRRRAAGGSTASACPNAILRRSTTTTPRGCSGLTLQ